MSQLVITVLNEAWEHFGAFPPEREREIAGWVQRRVQSIRDGAPMPTTAPELPRPFVSWYEREPGSDDA